MQHVFWPPFHWAESHFASGSLIDTNEEKTNEVSIPAQWKRAVFVRTVKQSQINILTHIFKKKTLTAKQSFHSFLDYFLIHKKIHRGRERCVWVSAISIFGVYYLYVKLFCVCWWFLPKARECGYVCLNRQWLSRAIQPASQSVTVEYVPRCCKCWIANWCWP